MLEYPLFITHTGKVLVAINNIWSDGDGDQYASRFGMPVNRQGVWLSGRLYCEEFKCTADVISEYCSILARFGKSSRFLQ